MRKLIITEKEAGQRIDKYLEKYFNNTSKSFIYKMIRKKNIVRNQKKITGSERILAGDEITLYLAEETIQKFHKEEDLGQYSKISTALDILYEDNNVTIINKPVGMLAQKSEAKDHSLVEYYISYLLENQELSQSELSTFRPAICNRLDRNTSGIVVAGKTIVGLQTMSELFRNRSIDKWYRCIVLGQIKKGKKI